MPSRKQVFIDHENECPHRNFICFYNTGCNAQVSLSKMLLHMKDIHGSKPLNEAKDIRSSTMLISPGLLRINASWTQTCFTLPDEGKQFYYNCFHISRQFFLWVYLIGSKKEEEKFTYTITLSNAKKVIFE